MRYILFLLPWLLSCQFDPGYQLDLELKELNYSERQGTGMLKLSYLPISKSDYLNFSLIQRPNDFLIQLPGINYSLKEIPSFFKSLTALKLTDLTFQTNTQTSKLLLPNYFHIYKNDSLSLEDVKIECHGGNVTEDLKERLIENCFNVMKLDSYRYFDQVDEFELLNLKINVRNKRLNAQGLIYSKINGNFEVKGSVSYLSESDELAIKVDQVKLGVLSVTNLFFKFAEKNQREGFRVKKPYLYFSLH